MALAAALLVSLFVRVQRPSSPPSIAYSNDIHAELAAGAPPKPVAPRVRAPKAPPPPSSPSGLKLVPIATDNAIKRVELLEKIPPEEGLMPVNLSVPAAPAAPTAAPEPSLGWGAWNQPAAEGTSGPGGIRQIPGLAPVLTAASPGGGTPAADAPGRPATDLPGALPAKASGWHHGHFHGGTLEAHQHGNALHKAHPRAGR